MESTSADLEEGTGSLCGEWSAPCEGLHCPVSSLGYSRSKPAPATVATALEHHSGCILPSEQSVLLFSCKQAESKPDYIHAYVPGHGGAHCATQLLLSRGRNRQSFKRFPIILRSLPDLWIHTILIWWIRSN